jgi:glycosyltransferase involved in cell wall biosynthesis
MRIFSKKFTANSLTQDVEAADYCLGEHLSYFLDHPMATYLKFPPDGFRYVSRPKKIELNHNINSHLCNIAFDTESSKFTGQKILRYFIKQIKFFEDKNLQSLFDAAKNITNLAANYGASPDAISDFLLSRSIYGSLSVPLNTKLAFISTSVNFLKSSPWVIEIEETTPLFAPFLRHGGDTWSVDIKNQAFYPVLKAMLEAQNCRAIVCHVNQTALGIQTLFNSEIINSKIFYGPMGMAPLLTKPKNHTQKKSINLIFTNSWHQSPNNFYYRGGKEVLDAFEILSSRYPEIHLTVRSSLPTLSDRYLKILKHHPRVKHFPEILDKIQFENLMMASDIMVIPACGLHLNTLFQAWSYAMPVIASDGFGFQEFVDHGVNGFCVSGRKKVCFFDDNAGIMRDRISMTENPNNSDQEVVEQLVKYLSILIEDSDKRIAMGQHGKHKIDSSYSLAQWNNTLARVFDFAIKRDEIP